MEMKFKEMLVKIMQDRDLNPNSFVEKTGVTRQSIYNYLKGAAPTLPNVVSIADFLNVDLNYLVYGLDIRTLHEDSREDLIQKLINLEKELISEKELSAALNDRLKSLQNYITLLDKQIERLSK